MQTYKFSLWLMVLVFCKSFAQGPPITTDKPIMLGQGTKLIKILIEHKNEEGIESTRIPLMFHYLPTANTLVAVHLPYLFGQRKGNDFQSLVPELVLKYQLYRKDGKAKTFRIVAKTLQKIPFQDVKELQGDVLNEYQGFYGFVAGYESISLGISNELGINTVANTKWNELSYKLGVGLPLLEPTYPVKQLNLFFETQQSYFYNVKDNILKYAQGIQYAKGHFTFDIAYQFPIYQKTETVNKFKNNLLLGTRFVF